MSPIGTSKLRAITKDVSDRLRDLFYRKSSSKELIIIDTTLNNLVENRMNPLENMMNQVASKVKQLPDESIIILARGLDKVF